MVHVNCWRVWLLLAPTNLTLTLVFCREGKLSNLQRGLLGIPVTAEDANVPLRHRLTQPTEVKPAPQPIKSPLGAPSVCLLSYLSNASPLTAILHGALVKKNRSITYNPHVGHGKHSTAFHLLQQCC